MYAVSLIVCAEGASTDRISGNLSLFNIMDSFQAAGFPVLVPSLSLVYFLTRAPEDPAQVTMRIRVTLNGDEIGVAHEVTSDFADKLSNRTAIKIEALVLPRPGRLVFEVAHQGTVLAHWALTVSPIQPTLFRAAPEGQPAGRG